MFLLCHPCLAHSPQDSESHHECYICADLRGCRALGKVNLLQLVIMTLIEVTVFSATRLVGMNYLNVSPGDVRRGLWIRDEEVSGEWAPSPFATASVMKKKKKK